MLGFNSHIHGVQLINRFNIVKFYSVILIAFIMLAPSHVFAQAKVGTAGVQFLKVGVGTRAVGMGEAFTAVANDASALYYNPGGLIQLTKPEATFTLIDYPAGLKFIYVGGVVPVPMLSGVFGMQVTSLFTDDMLETTPEMPYGTGRTFTASDLALGISYCQRLTDKFSVGGSFKYLNERLADESATGWSADVGTFYTTGWKRINIGMVIQNFGPDMVFVNAPFPLPMTFKFGASMIAWEQPGYELLLAGEFIHPNDNVEVYNIGAEFTASNMISFRIGKKLNGFMRDTWDEYQEDSKKDPFVEYPLLEKDEDGSKKLSLDGFSFGLGVVIPQAGVTVDYSWAKIGTLGGAHRFTIGYKLNALFF
jgi:hypothetical protein